MNKPSVELLGDDAWFYVCRQITHRTPVSAPRIYLTYNHSVLGYCCLGYRCCHHSGLEERVISRMTLLRSCASRLVSTLLVNLSPATQTASVQLSTTMVCSHKCSAPVKSLKSQSVKLGCHSSSQCSRHQRHIKPLTGTDSLTPSVNKANFIPDIYE